MRGTRGPAGSDTREEHSRRHVGPRYTSGLKTAISLPDEVFARAEKLAKRLGKSRSELYRDAVAEFLARHDPEEITAAMDRVADQIETRLDPFGRGAAADVLKRTEW